MGTSHEMGRNESCIWRSTFSAVVQPVHRPASAAFDAVDPRSTCWVWVFRLRSRADWCSWPRLDRAESKISWPRLRRTSFVWGYLSWVGDTETCYCSGTPVHHNHHWKFVLSLPHADVDPTFSVLLCTSMLNNWNIFLTWAAFCFVCFYMKHAVCNSNESFIPDHIRCCQKSTRAPLLHD